ncbi:MAG TPA: c-type cytochrome [Caulobacteraceae bacterium]|jgi:cytochrome c1|nr:c-type cytochrome [Caulobacteraceae bacterium]
MIRMISAALALASASVALAACGSRSPPIWPAFGGDPARGAAMISRVQCGACHEIPGIADAHGLVGPPLAKFGRRTMIAGMLPNTPDALVQWLRDPQSVIPGNAMPSTNLTDQQARDVAAYLYTLR